MADEPQGTPPPGGWLPPETQEGAIPGGGAPHPPPPLWSQQPPPEPYGRQPDEPRVVPQAPQAPPPYPQQPPQWGQYGQQQHNPHAQPSPWASSYQWQQAEPDNTPAMAGFIMSLASIGTLVMFFGLLSPINFCLSVAAMFVSRTGIRKVESGETTKNGDLAKWGFWLGLAGAVLAALVIIAFVALITSDPDWLDDLETSEPR